MSKPNARLPYVYTVTMAVRVVADGQHADGDGAMATRDRLLGMVRADERVLAATAAVSVDYTATEVRRKASRPA